MRRRWLPVGMALVAVAGIAILAVRLGPRATAVGATRADAAPRLSVASASPAPLSTAATATVDRRNTTTPTPPTVITPLDITPPPTPPATPRPPPTPPPTLPPLATSGNAPPTSVTTPPPLISATSSVAPFIATGTPDSGHGSGLGTVFVVLLVVLLALGGGSLVLFLRLR